MVAEQCSPFTCFYRRLFIAVVCTNSKELIMFTEYNFFCVGNSVNNTIIISSDHHTLQ